MATQGPIEGSAVTVAERAAAEDPVLDAGVRALGTPGIAALCAIAFFSGFSERFVTGVLESSLAK